MASSSAMRSIFGSCSAHPSAFRLALEVKATRSSFRFVSNKHLSLFTIRPKEDEMKIKKQRWHDLDLL